MDCFFNAGTSMRLWFILPLLKYITTDCQFPEFVQTREPGVHWIGMYSYKEYLTATFKGGDMRASHCHKVNDCRSFERICLERYVGGTFLVAHRRPHAAQTYMCMDILRRSKSVIQLRTSRENARPSKSLCRNMRQDNNPLISNTHYENTRVTCPIVGGFDVNIFTASYGSQICPDTLLPMRLESECESEDGMVFKFRKEECIHRDLAMKMEQTVYCIAVWTEGPYKFVVLREEDTFRTWCMRFSANGNNGAHTLAYLFMDFVCDPSENLIESKRYLRLVLHRRILSNLCVDEFEHCLTDRSFLCQSDDIRPHCPLACGMCHAKGDVHSCNFDETYRGTWMQSTRQGNRRIKITSNHFSIEHGGNYKCVRFNNRTVKSSLSLLRTFDNGCYPRFVCAEFERPAPSVLHYRLGNSIVWPIFHHDYPYNLICSDKSFHIPLSNDNNHHHNIQYPLPQKSQTSIVNLNEEQAVFCNLSVEYGAKIPFVDQYNCSGCLSQDGGGGPSDRLSMHYSNCSNRPDYVEYLCFASFKSIGTYDRLLTRTVGGNDEYLCWVFISLDKVVILPGAECSRYEARLAHEGGLAPIDIINLRTMNNNSLCESIVPEPKLYAPVISETQLSAGKQLTVSMFSVNVFFICKISNAYLASSS